MSVKISAGVAVGALTFLLALIVPTSINAFDNPQQFYDWNTYSPQNKVLGLKVSAQEGTPATNPSPSQNYTDYKQHDYFLSFTKDFTPNNPFYFLKKAEEAATTVFTFDPKVREEKRVEFAGERLQEIQSLVKDGKTANIASVVKAYENSLTQISQDLKSLKAQGQNVDTVAENVDLEASKQNLVLAQTSFEVPQDPENNFKTALEASERAVDVVADINGKTTVPDEVVQRLQSLKVQGLLSQEEVNKIISSPSREQARDEMRKFVTSRVIPESDFVKFNETARTQFPQAYYTNLEVKKFEELRDLETQKPDDQTLQKVQQFAKAYKSGDTVPQDLRRWWVPLVRLEELQNTIRPDLIPQDSLRNRPDALQKYQEVIERMKPTEKDIKYVDGLIKENPNLLNDPSYARIKALADKFGTNTQAQPNQFQSGQSCGNGAHWVNIPFMPNGGYCVPNYDFPVTTTSTGTPTKQPCPSGYHRPSPESSCYTDNPNINIADRGFTAPGSCPSGYNWVPERSTSRGGYCAPFSVNDGGGFPSPIYTPGYCLPGQVFRDGKCETYNPAPAQGCGSGGFWNGNSCVTVKNCGPNSYQDSNGECKSSSTGPRMCPQPPGGCGFNSYWDNSSCSCRSTTTTGGGPTGPGTGGSCSPPPGGCGSGYFDNGSCSCKPASSQGCYNVSASSCGSGFTWDAGACTCRSNSPNGGTPYIAPPPGNYPTPPGVHDCGSGYAWNGSYCTPTNVGPAPGSNGSGSSNYQSPPSYQNPPAYQNPPPSTYQSPPSEYQAPPAYQNPPPSTYQSPPSENPPVQGAKTEKGLLRYILESIFR